MELYKKHYSEYRKNLQIMNNIFKKEKKYIIDNLCESNIVYVIFSKDCPHRDHVISLSINYYGQWRNKKFDEHLNTISYIYTESDVYNIIMSKECCPRSKDNPPLYSYKVEVNKDKHEIYNDYSEMINYQNCSVKYNKLLNNKLIPITDIRVGIVACKLLK